MQRESSMPDEEQHLSIETELGTIKLRLRRDSAPVTCDYICKLAKDGLYTDTHFYRAGFVIQCGLSGSGKTSPYDDLPVNETNMHEFVSNKKGTCSVAHWDIPDNGNSEFFINFQDNTSLDTAFGGYCVFAEVEDEESFKVVEKIAEIILKTDKAKILRVGVE